MKKKTEKPNCYECAHRGCIPGDAHSRCQHPDAGGTNKDPLAEMFAIFAGVGRCGPVIDTNAAVKMGVKLDPHGVRNGWACWPFNFDPTWLLACNGFKKKLVTSE